MTDDNYKSMKAKFDTLQVFVRWLHTDYRGELERRRRGPGGQHAGSPPLAGVPISTLVQIERDTRHALEAIGVRLDIPLSTLEAQRED